MPADPAAADSAGDLQLALQLQQQEDEEHQQRMAAQRHPSGQRPGQAPAAQAAAPGVPHTPGRGSRHAPGPSHAHHRCTPLPPHDVADGTCTTPGLHASSNLTEGQMGSTSKGKRSAAEVYWSLLKAPRNCSKPAQVSSRLCQSPTQQTMGKFTKSMRVALLLLM